MYVRTASARSVSPRPRIVRRGMGAPDLYADWLKNAPLAQNVAQPPSCIMGGIGCKTTPSAYTPPPALPASPAPPVVAQPSYRTPVSSYANIQPSARLASFPFAPLSRPAPRTTSTPARRPMPFWVPAAAGMRGLRGLGAAVDQPCTEHVTTTFMSSGRAIQSTIWSLECYLAQLLYRLEMSAPAYANPAEVKDFQSDLDAFAANAQSWCDGVQGSNFSCSGSSAQNLAAVYRQKFIDYLKNTVASDVFAGTTVAAWLTPGKTLYDYAVGSVRPQLPAAAPASTPSVPTPVQPVLFPAQTPATAAGAPSAPSYTPQPPGAPPVYVPAAGAPPAASSSGSGSNTSAATAGFFDQTISLFGYNVPTWLLLGGGLAAVGVMASQSGGGRR